MKRRHAAPQCRSRYQMVRRISVVGLALLACTLASLPLAAEQPVTPTSGIVIPIRGVIDEIMRDSIERRLDEARAAGAGTVIFELNTPGGMVTSALDICRLIKGLPSEIRTVAWVNPQAYSAGAMVSVACHEIWMSPSSSIGDCAPIMVTPVGGLEQLGEAERAKAESPILQEFRDSAARNGYDPLLSRAMVAVGTQVWWIENTQTGERRFVSDDEKDELVDKPDQPVWMLARTYKLPGTDREYPVEQPVDREDTLLTLSQYDAVGFGFAKGIADDLRDLTNRLGLARTPQRLELTGWENFAAWLNSPLVRGLLLVIVLIGAYIEFQSPGLILPGATALLALAIFLAAPYAAGLATVWPIILLGLGLILLAIEIFVLPGFGIAGLLGLALMLVAIVASFIPAEPELPTFSAPSLHGITQGLKTAVAVLFGSLAVSLVGIVLLAKYLPQSRLSRGVVSANPIGDAMALNEAYATVALVGDVGVVTGDLRPAGQARFGGEIVDVRSQGEYVGAGRRVQVIRREGMNILVRSLPDEEQPPNA